MYICVFTIGLLGIVSYFEHENIIAVTSTMLELKNRGLAREDEVERLIGEISSIVTRLS